MNQLEKETKNELVSKILKTYELDTHDVKGAVELYYDCQKLRIMYADKEAKQGGDHLKTWLAYYLWIGETVVSQKLQEWILSDRAPAEALWAYEQMGVGPILAAGLATYIDIRKADSISAVWKFAGQAPGYDRRQKGIKLPFCAALKTHCWKVAKSFVFVSGRKDAVYGQLYKQFKREEEEKNAAGKNAEAAARELATKKIVDKETKAMLQSGKLIQAHVHARAMRRTIKRFLGDYWCVGRKALNLPIREPYVIGMLGHALVDPAGHYKVKLSE